MVWRLYYTIKEAAEELSKHFNERYSADDIIHYGANNITRLCLNNLVPAHLAKVFVYRINEFDEDFISIDNDKFIKNQAIIDGSGLIKPDFIVVPIRYLQAIEKFPKDTFSLNRVNCLISNNELIYPTPSRAILNKLRLQNINNIEWDFCIFPHLNSDMLNKFMDGNLFLTNELDSSKNLLTFSIDDLYITSYDFNELKQDIKEKLNIPSKQPSHKTTNKQAEIIAALAVAFLGSKEDLNEPRAAAKELLSALELKGLSGITNEKTLAEYLSNGLDRLP